VRLPKRFGGLSQPNGIGQVKAQLEAAGIRLTDLTDSNPTHFGLGTPQVLEVVADAARRATRYSPDPQGPLPAREALAARFGGGPEEYWLTASTSEAYAWIFKLLCEPGEAVAVPTPGYPLVEPLAALNDITTVCFPWHYLPAEGWYLDCDLMAQATQRPQVKGLVLVNPGNPTGTYLNPAVREAAVEACSSGGCVLVVDQVFAPFVLEGERFNLAGEEPVVSFAFDGLSKLLCAPGLKISWLRLSGPEDQLQPLRSALGQIADAYLSVNAPAALALPELLNLSDGVVENTRQRLLLNLVTARQILDAPPYRVRRCEGGWSAVVDVPAVLPDDDLVIHLMRHAGLAVHPGWFYDLAEPATLVLSLLPPPAVFAENCGRLRAAIDAL
jgi:aspartate/methionine/tyrosine aminotransferase